MAGRKKVDWKTVNRGAILYRPGDLREELDAAIKRLGITQQAFMDIAVRSLIESSKDLVLAARVVQQHTATKKRATPSHARH